MTAGSLNATTQNDVAVSPNESNVSEDAGAPDLIVEESAEASEARGIKVSNKPTPEEVAEHELTHLPFRSWCKHCVFGRAQADFHMKVDSENRDVPRLSWDYMYMKEKQERERETR